MITTTTTTTIYNQCFLFDSPLELFHIQFNYSNGDFCLIHYYILVNGLSKNYPFE